jgi:hypothetical protein
MSTVRGKGNLVGMEMRQQTDPFFQYATGIPRWACRLFCCLAIPQFEEGRPLKNTEILMIYDHLLLEGIIIRHSVAENYRLDMPGGVIKPTQYAADWMSPGTYKVYHQGNENTNYGPHNYELRKNITHKRYDEEGNWIGGGGPHWTLEKFQDGKNIGEIYNPDLSLEYEPTDHFLRMQIVRRKR